MKKLILFILLFATLFSSAQKNSDVYCKNLYVTKSIKEVDSIYLRNFGWVGPYFLNKILLKIDSVGWFEKYVTRKALIDTIKKHSSSGKIYYSGQGINIDANHKINMGDSIPSNKNHIYVDPYYTNTSEFILGRQSKSFDNVEIAGSNITFDGTDSAFSRKHVIVLNKDAIIFQGNSDSLYILLRKNEDYVGFISAYGGEIYFQNNSGIRRSLTQLANKDIQFPIIGSNQTNAIKLSTGTTFNNNSLIDIYTTNLNYGIYVHNSSIGGVGTGIGVYNDNAGIGNYLYNANIGIGNYIENFSSGIGMYVVNSDVSTGIAFKIKNESTGIPIKITNYYDDEIFSITKDGSINTALLKTTIIGSTSGIIIWCMPFQGNSYKKVLIQFNSFNDAGVSITYPIAFNSVPAIISNTTGLTISTITTSAITIPVSLGATGWIILEGF